MTLKEKKREAFFFFKVHMSEDKTTSMTFLLCLVCVLNLRGASKG